MLTPTSGHFCKLTYSDQIEDVWAVQVTCCNAMVNMSIAMSAAKDYQRFWMEFIDIYKENLCLWKVKIKELRNV